MLDNANYTPRLKAAYIATIRAALKEEFGYKNDMQIPRLDKIVLNIGCGAEAVRDSKKAKSAQEDLSTIAGQKAVTTVRRNPSLVSAFVKTCLLVRKLPFVATRCTNSLTV